MCIGPSGIALISQTPYTNPAILLFRSTIPSGTSLNCSNGSNQTAEVKGSISFFGSTSALTALGARLTYTLCGESFDPPGISGGKIQWRAFHCITRSARENLCQERDSVRQPGSAVQPPTIFVFQTPTGFADRIRYGGDDWRRVHHPRGLSCRSRPNSIPLFGRRYRVVRDNHHPVFGQRTCTAADNSVQERCR